MPIIPSRSGNLQAWCYVDEEGKEHFVATSGRLIEPVLVRIHSECLTGDVFGSLRCDCGEQLALALRAINSEGGVIVYLRQEGRGIGLKAKLAAYDLQDDEGYDTVEANLKLGHLEDARSYDNAVAILNKMSVTRVRLMTNNPKKAEYLKANGIEVVEIVPCRTVPTAQNERYLKTKKTKMGHDLQT